MERKRKKKLQNFLEIAFLFTNKKNLKQKLSASSTTRQSMYIQLYQGGVGREEYSTLHLKNGHSIFIQILGDKRVPLGLNLCFAPRGIFLTGLAWNALLCY